MKLFQASVDRSNFAWSYPYGLQFMQGFSKIYSSLYSIQKIYNGLNTRRGKRLKFPPNPIPAKLHALISLEISTLIPSLQMIGNTKLYIKIMSNQQLKYIV